MKWRVSIAQCKLFIEDDMAANEDDFTPLSQQGFVLDYKYRTDVMRFLSDQADSCNNARRAQYLERLQRCDAVVVVVLVVKPCLVKFRDRANFEQEAATFEDIQLVVMEKEARRLQAAVEGLQSEGVGSSVEAEVVVSNSSRKTTLSEEEKEEEEELRNWLSVTAGLKKGCKCETSMEPEFVWKVCVGYD
jgi:hypothetical protein